MTAGFVTSQSSLSRGPVHCAAVHKCRIPDNFMLKCALVPPGGGDTIVWQLYLVEQIQGPDDQVSTIKRPMEIDNHVHIAGIEVLKKVMSFFNKHAYQNMQCSVAKENCTKNMPSSL